MSGTVYIIVLFYGLISDREFYSRFFVLFWKEIFSSLKLFILLLRAPFYVRSFAKSFIVSKMWHACEIHDFFVLLILNREKILLSFYFAILFNKNSFLSLNQSISTQKSTGMSKCQNVRIFHIVQFFEFSDSLIVNGCKEEILEAWSKRNFFSIKLPQNILSD